MSTHLLKRRTVLRGAAVLARSLAGCQKKEEPPARPQTSEPAAPAPGSPSPQADGASSGDTTGGAASGSASSSPPQGGKLSKTQAQYQDQPKGEQKCGNCMHFIAGSNTCKVVEGKISPNGWCMLWAQKQG